MTLSHAWVLVQASVVLVACAHGNTTDMTWGAGGEGVGGGGTAPVSSSEGGKSSSSTTTMSPGGDTGGTGGTGGTGTGGTTTAPGCDYAAPDTCPAAQQLPSIDGDSNHDIRTVTGDTSMWFKVRVNESVSSILSYPQLSYTATLQPPAGVSYALYAYTGDDVSPSCSGPVGGTGAVPMVSATWGDTLAVDDTTWITLEVRYLAGTACGADATWTLTVEGHTHP